MMLYLNMILGCLLFGFVRQAAMQTTKETHSLGFLAVSGSGWWWFSHEQHSDDGASDANDGLVGVDAALGPLCRTLRCPATGSICFHHHIPFPNIRCVGSEQVRFQVCWVSDMNAYVQAFRDLSWLFGFTIHNPH